MPLTPIRRSFSPVTFPHGPVENAGIWRFPRARRGVPGEVLIHRPGGWGSVVALARLLIAVVRT